MVAFCVCGRGDEIRTRDILVPNQALYQAELRPENRIVYLHHIFYFASIILKFYKFSLLFPKHNNDFFKINYISLKKLYL